MYYYRYILFARQRRSWRWSILYMAQHSAKVKSQIRHAVNLENELLLCYLKFDFGTNVRVPVDFESIRFRSSLLFFLLRGIMPWQVDVKYKGRRAGWYDPHRRGIRRNTLPVPSTANCREINRCLPWRRETRSLRPLSFAWRYFNPRGSRDICTGGNVHFFVISFSFFPM